jgi:hypothetical protein
MSELRLSSQRQTRVGYGEDGDSDSDAPRFTAPSPPPSVHRTTEQRGSQRGCPPKAGSSSPKSAAEEAPEMPTLKNETKPHVPLRAYERHANPLASSLDIDIVCDALAEAQRGERPVDTDTATAVTMPMQILTLLSLATVAIASLVALVGDKVRDNVASFCIDNQGHIICTSKEELGFEVAAQGGQARKPFVLQELDNAVVLMAFYMTVVVVIVGGVVTAVSLYMTWTKSDAHKVWAS